MTNSYTTIPNFGDIDQLLNEAIGASNCIAFGDQNLVDRNIERLKDAMDQINARNLYFTRLAVLEEMENVLSDVNNVDINILDLAYLHREYSNNSESALNF